MTILWVIVFTVTWITSTVGAIVLDNSFIFMAPTIASIAFVLAFNTSNQKTI